MTGLVSSKGRLLEGVVSEDLRDDRTAEQELGQSKRATARTFELSS